MPNGWIILDKPVGLGSTQAVAAVKRNLREAGYGKKVKVGHGGTLDPLASGVLPIAVGEATKLTGRMLDASKVYEFTVAFGTETDTLDLEGAVVATSDVRPTADQVEAMLPRFTGPIEQVPPVYSALKVDGQRAYDLVRAGEEVQLASRSVAIHSLEVIASDLPDAITLNAHVSKGTYIRSLARDIAQALETCGHVTHLRRIKAGPFTLEQAISLDILNEIGKGAPLERKLLPLEAGLDDIPALDLDPEEARAVRQGRVLSGMSLTDGQYWARAGGVPVALVELAGGEARVVRGFNLTDVAE
ncbi:MAG: tRNA pseudouridine(55) synthase TruB [Novosphingobium sp.]|nr:tRNA pseudouridine(55) synthase TruB [Novosphingobium sp.]